MIVYGTIFFFVSVGYSQGGTESIPCFVVAVIVAVYEYLAVLPRKAGKAGFSKSLGTVWASSTGCFWRSF